MENTVSYEDITDDLHEGYHSMSSMKSIVASHVWWAGLYFDNEIYVNRSVTYLEAQKLDRAVYFTDENFQDGKNFD